MQVQLKAAPNPSHEARCFDADFFAEDVPIRKTLAGHHEFEQRRLPLRAELRRALIMIDGKRSTRSLSHCMRSYDVAQLVDELSGLGLIEPIDATPLFDAQTARASTSISHELSDAQFECLRQTAMTAAHELLGSLARPYCVAMSLCGDRKRLGDLFDEVEERIRRTLGSDAATVFCETLKDAAVPQNA
jgi:hypothetical protein